MGAAAFVDYAYRYAGASGVKRQGTACSLRLATFGGVSAQQAEHPFFFDGEIREPQIASSMLLALANIVSTRFWMAVNPTMFDPVVTSSEEVLRFEGFSSCCGAYVRADFGADAFDGEIQGRGTTNVDFNCAMRGTLAQIRATDAVRLAVGSDRLEMTRGDDAVVERKVKLPARWIKGFAEVQPYLAQLTVRFALPAIDALRFIRALPRGGNPKSAWWVTELGRGVRLAQHESPRSVRITGPERLRVIEPILPFARELRVWADESSSVSAWEVDFPTSRFTVLISPEVSRGFSGEGQILARLTGKQWQNALPYVRSALRWQSRIDAGEMCAGTALSAEQVEAALAMLGSRGLVGFDLGRGAYFHRELPFDMDKVESLHPRLLDARKLVAEQKIRIDSQSGAGEQLRVAAWVQGTEVEHRVRLEPTGEFCTCPWYGKHQGDRGPCKHVLAVRLLLDQHDE
jgi:hypothetical protein